MVDVFLIVLSVVVPLLVLALSGYLVVYYSHPDDFGSYWSKTLLVLGISLSIIGVLLIPLDVANLSGTVGCGVFADCGQLDLGSVWQGFYVTVAVFVIFLIPYTIFFYESYDKTKSLLSQGCSAMCWQVTSTVVAVGVFVILWVFLKYTEIPVKDYPLLPGNFASCDFSSPQGLMTSADPALTNFCASNSNEIGLNSSALVITKASWSKVSRASDEVIVIPTSFIIFMTGVLAFLGWFFLALYAGIGLISLPYDLIQSFIHRPQYVKPDTCALRMSDIGKKTRELIELGTSMAKHREKGTLMAAEVKIGDGNSKAQKKGGWFGRGGGGGGGSGGGKGSVSRVERTAQKEFKKAVRELELEYEDLKICNEFWKNYNPFISYGKLACGILGAILSLLWVLHIILYLLVRNPYPNGTPTSPFLNDVLTWASKTSGFALLGVIFLSIFAFYLYFCILKGNFKFGLRFMIMEIHPMKMGGTYMSSFLVNVSLILMTTPSLIQFISSSFADYVVLTDVDAIFGQQIRNMRFFSYFFANNVFELIMLGVSLLTFIWVFCVPSQDISHAREVRRRIQKWSEEEAKNGPKTKASAAAAKAAAKVNGKLAKGAAVADKKENGGSANAEAVTIEMAGMSDDNGAGLFDPKLDDLYGDGGGGEDTMHDNPFGAPNKRGGGDNAARNQLFST